MRTALVIVATVVALCALALGCLYFWCTVPDETTWTARSPEALKELEEGVDDLSRRYFRDAVIHFERALDLDADMPGAKLFLAYIYSELPAERDRYLGALRDADPDAMNELERLLRSYLLAVSEGNRTEAMEGVEQYLAEHPDDPWALDLKCSNAWLARDWAKAETCYRRLLAVDPNWVEAQGRLGSIAMARGRFGQAEEHFRTYAYIAPDQADPHASLGQLLAILGRYEEADQALDQALEVKDDFCDAYRYRVSLQILEHRLDDAQTTLDTMESLPACGIFAQWGIYCASRSRLHYLQGDVEAAKAEMDDECLEARGGWDAGYHRLAVLTGDEETARVQLARARRGLEGKQDDPEARTYFLEAIVQHMQGLQAAVSDDWPTACDLFAAADQDVQYWMISRASFKLRNRHDLLVCLEHEGRSDEARELAEQIAAVNPRYLESPVVTDLMELAGLDSIE